MKICLPFVAPNSEGKQKLVILIYAAISTPFLSVRRLGIYLSLLVQSILWQESRTVSVFFAAIKQESTRQMDLSL